MKDKTKQFFLKQPFLKQFLYGVCDYCGESVLYWKLIDVAPCVASCKNCYER